MARKNKSIAELAQEVTSKDYDKPIGPTQQKRRGRKPGTKNKPKSKDYSSPIGPVQQKRRGRPKGSAAKPAASETKRGRPASNAMGSSLGSLKAAVGVVKKARDLLASAGCEIRRGRGDTFIE